MTCLRSILCAAAVLATLAVASAHDPGLSTGQIRILPEHIEAELIFARADIEATLILDANSDGRVSAAEMAAVKHEAATIARGALSVRLDNLPVPAQLPGFRLDEMGNVHITATFPSRDARRLSVTSMLMDRMPRGHRQFMSVHGGQGRVLTEVLLQAGQDSIDLDVANSSATSKFGDFFRLGVGHIVTGYDHLLFLFALLFVVPNFRSAALIITSFTVAHSITLGAATLNWVNVDSKYIEPLIAVTIVYVGVENLVRRDGPHGRCLLTFAFGLIHGFGFASVLRELGVSSGTTGIAMPLCSFNLGVETGQMAIATLILPVIFALRSRPVFIRRWMPAFSTVVIGLGVWWFAERTLP